MSVTERLMSQGRVSFTLRPETPQRIIDLFRPLTPGIGYGTIAITPTRLELGAVGSAGVLANARYTGRLLRRERRRQISGDGVAGQFGTENGYGTVASNVSSTTFAAWATTIRPDYVSAGINPVPGGASYTRSYRATTVRQLLDEVCAFFGGEWRLNPNLSLDIGTRSQLFVTTPKTVIVARKGDGGRDLNITGIVGDLELSEDVQDWERARLLYWGSGGTSVQQANGSVAPAAVPFREPDGTSAEIRRVTENTAISSAADALGVATGEWNKVRDGYREFRVSTDAYDIGRDVGVGDSVYVYDPSQGVVNTANAVPYRGGTIFPESIRCVGRTWPIRNGMGVYLRRWTDNGTATWAEAWTDVSEYVMPESGDAELELFALPRKLRVT